MAIPEIISDATESEQGLPQELAPDPEIRFSGGRLVADTSDRSRSMLLRRFDYLQMLASDVLHTAKEVAVFVGDAKVRRRLSRGLHSERPSQGYLQAGEQPRRAGGELESGEPFVAEYVKRLGEPPKPGLPQLAMEHGLGGTRGEFGPLGELLDEYTILSRNRYPARADGRPESSGDYRAMFGSELAKQAAILRKEKGPTVGVGHSLGTVYWRMLVEVASEHPELIGLREHQPVRDKVPVLVLFTPTELENGAKRSPLDIVYGTPEFTRLFMNGLAKATRGLDTVAERIPPLERLVDEVESWGNVGLMSSLVLSRLGSPEHLDPAVMRTTILDVIANAPRAMRDEFGMLLSGGSIFGLTERDPEDMPLTLVLSSSQDGCVSEESNNRAIAELEACWGPERIIPIIFDADHGLPFDRRYVEDEAELIRQVTADPEGFLREVRRVVPPGGRLRYESLAA